MDEKLRDIDQRLEEIRSLDISAMDDQAEVEKLTAEAKELNEKRAALIEERKQAEAKVLATAEVTEKHENREAKPMEEKITRDSQAYLDAYIEAKKTGDDTELRALLSTNAASGGTIAVPVAVEEAVEDAWNKDKILNRVRATEYPGNYEANFYISGSGAVIHAEGGAEIGDEELNLGTVTLIPQSVKKNLAISKAALKLRGQAFLDSMKQEVYDEVMYAAGGVLLTDIINAPATSSATTPGVPTVSVSAFGSNDIINAEALLSDRAINKVAIMNARTYAAYKSIRTSDGYPVAIFDGIEVLIDNRLPALADASAGDALVILGDLNYGARANFPDGKEVEIIVDRVTRKKGNIVDIFGELFLSIGVTQANAFAKIVKQ